MEKEVAKAIADCGEVCEADVELRDDYSARGAYGDTTYAVVCDLQTFIQCACLAVKHADEAEQDSIVQAMAGVRQDSMGRSSSIFY